MGQRLQEGQIVRSGFPLRYRMCHWTRTVELRVRGPLACLAVLSSRPLSPFVVPVPGSCPGCRGAAPRGEACCSGPCLGRCTPCGLGLMYAGTVWRLRFGSWCSRCSLCAVTGLGPVPGAWCRPAVCGCSLCFGYTPCVPGSGYAGVLRYLRFGLWGCSRYVVMGFGLVPVPVGVVLLPLLSSPPRGDRLCRQCRGHSSSGCWFLAPCVRCVPGGSGVGAVCLVRAPGFRGRRDHRGRPGVVSPLGLLLMACSALRVPPGRRRPGAPAPSCPVFVLRVWSFLRATYVGVEAPPVRAPHTIPLRVVTCVCATYTGLVGGIPLALCVGVSWILFARCIARHKWPSLSSVSSSHVEQLRHIGGRVRSCCVAAYCLWMVAWRRVVVLSCWMALNCVALRGCGVASCRSVCYVVSLCGVRWCLVVPGVGCAMLRFVLFFVVGCAVQYCAVLCCCRVAAVWLWCRVLCAVDV